MEQPMNLDELWVVYGSQTGTAQSCAEAFSRHSLLYNFLFRISSCDDFVLRKEWPKGLVVFIIATAGDGTAPRNMANFWTTLKNKHLPLSYLQNICYAVFGLGDSSYTKYNFMGKMLNRRLEHLGANRIHPLGLGDDQNEFGHEKEFELWSDGVLQWLCEQNEIFYIKRSLEDSLLPPKLAVVEMIENSDDNMKMDCELYAEMYEGKILKNERITAIDHFQDIRHIELPVFCDYAPSDVLQIFPQNSASAVNDIIEALGWQSHCDKKLAWKDNSSRSRWYGWTIRELFTQVLEINGPPRRSFFQIIHHFADDSNDGLHKEKLYELATSNGYSDWLDYCWRPKRTYAEVIMDFKGSLKEIPMEYIWDLFPVIQPRQFSISSCQSGLASMTMSVVEYKTNMKKMRIGLCSNWLASLPIDTPVKYTIERGLFSFPSNTSTPLILICAGTGIAIARSIVQSKKFPNIYLFYGFRYNDKDFLYQNELTAITSLCTVTSREEPKEYVQNLLGRKKDLVWDLVSTKNAHIYVSGNKKLPSAISSAMKNIAAEKGMTDVDRWWKSLEVERRYQIECW